MNEKRLFAGIIDFVITGIFQAIFMFTFLIFPLINNQLDFALIFPRAMSITYTSMLYMVFRDIIGSKSIGKRIIKLKIIDKTTSNEATILKRLARNVTLFFAPIELIVFLITKYRIGDRLAGTTVVEM